MILTIFGWMATGGDSNTSPFMGFAVPMLLIILIFYFLMIRPQIKRQKDQKAMIESLRKGDKVVAAGGILGTIAGLKDKDNIVILKVDDNVKIEVSKSSISSVIRKE